jgi:hypothetical protein
MEWWRNLSKGARWAICMTTAFVPLLIVGAFIKMGYTVSPWVLIPVIIICGLFSTWAYAIRIS